MTQGLVACVWRCVGRGRGRGAVGGLGRGGLCGVLVCGESCPVGQEGAGVGAGWRGLPSRLWRIGCGVCISMCGCPQPGRQPARPYCSHPRRSTPSNVSCSLYPHPMPACSAAAGKPLDDEALARVMAGCGMAIQLDEDKRTVSGWLVASRPRRACRLHRVSRKGVAKPGPQHLARVYWTRRPQPCPVAQLLQPGRRGTCG
jgi:hypothetical protein